MIQLEKGGERLQKSMPVMLNGDNGMDLSSFQAF